MSPRLMLKSLRSAAIRAYTWKPLYAGLPFAPGVASASPVIAKLTLAAAVAAGAVRKRPSWLTALPCRNRYEYAVFGRSLLTGTMTLKSFVARAVVATVVAPSSRTTFPAFGARVHSSAPVDVTSPAATP